MRVVRALLILLDQTTFAIVSGSTNFGLGISHACRSSDTSEFIFLLRQLALVRPLRSNRKHLRDQPGVRSCPDLNTRSLSAFLSLTRGSRSTKSHRTSSRSTSHTSLKRRLVI